MPTAADIPKLGQLLPTLWIEKEIVDKAIAYLHAEPTDVKRWGGVAVDFRNAGKYYAADVALQLALARFPGEALLWHQRGFLFDAWQKDEAAIALFDRALQLDPLLGPAQFGEVQICHVIGFLRLFTVGRLARIRTVTKHIRRKIESLFGLTLNLYCF